MSGRPQLQPGDPVRVADPKFEPSTVFTVKAVDGDLVEIDVGSEATASLPRASLRTLSAQELDGPSAASYATEVIGAHSRQLERKSLQSVLAGKREELHGLERGIDVSDATQPRRAGRMPVHRRERRAAELRGEIASIEQRLTTIKEIDAREDTRVEAPAPAEGDFATFRHIPPRSAPNTEPPALTTEPPAPPRPVRAAKAQAPGAARLQAGEGQKRAGVVRDILGATAQPARPDQGTVAWLPLASIDRSSLNPRRHFPEDELEQLAASLQTDGLLQPIVVKPVGERFEIVAGERRWRAAKQLGWTEIAAIVREGVDEATHLRLALLENLARTDLDPLEEAEGYRQLQALGMTQQAIASSVHRSQPAIANAIRLLRAPHEILDQVVEGKLTPSHVLALLRYEQFPAVMRKVAEIAVEDHLTSKELEEGLPDAYDLVRDGLARQLGRYRANFDTTVCETCPFDARRKGASGAYADAPFYCLKPEHYDQLQAEAQAERQKAVQRQIEKAKASGKKLPKLSDLKYDSYVRIHGAAPEGCSEQCACRGAGIDCGNEVVAICTDPKQFHKLQSAATRRENADKRAQLNELLDRLNDKLDLLEEIGEREVAIVAAAAVRSLGTPDFKQAVTWSGGLVEVKDLEDYRLRDELPATLAHLSATDLVRMFVYAVLHHELRDAFTAYGRGEHPWADWYLADQPPRPKGKPLVEAFHADGHLADEIAAEQERLEAEYAAAETAGAV